MKWERSVSIIRRNQLEFELSFYRGNRVQLKAYPGKIVELGDLTHHVFLFKEYNKKYKTYRAFCGGSIITAQRVLTSAHCLLTNRKHLSRTLSKVRVVAAALETYAKPTEDETAQWRSIKKILSQEFYRYPAFNLAILEVDEPWVFNSNVQKIPYASLNQDFDGVCSTTCVKATKSWAARKSLCTERMQIIRRDECELQIQRSCKLYYCTDYDKVNVLSSHETEGGGLICFNTGDPREGTNGILVGVTAQINYRLPTLHSRVGQFHKWITDSSSELAAHKFMYFASFICMVIH